MTEVKTAEVVQEMALVKASEIESLVKEQDRPLLKIMDGLATLDWKDLKPNQMAVLLMQKPFSVKGGGQLFLNFRQALHFAVRCYELNVSPFSNEVFFDPARFSVNLTLEGKKQVARNKGIDLGPPQFEALTREWKDLPRMTEGAEDAKKAGFTKDIGYKCKMRVGPPEHKEYVEYTAWLSEWLVTSSPVWKAKPEHMLQTRACEKGISLALGTGASAMPSEGEIE